MNDRALRGARGGGVAELLALAPSSHEDGESILAATLDTGSDGRRLLGLGLIALCTVAAAIFGVTTLIQGARPELAGPGLLTPDTAAETDLAVQLPNNAVQPRQGARYCFEGFDPPAAPCHEEEMLGRSAAWPCPVGSWGFEVDPRC